MQCPNCGLTGVSRVVESRNKDGAIYRRRECTVCGHRFSTMERIHVFPKKPGKDDRNGKGE